MQLLATLCCVAAAVCAAAAEGCDVNIAGDIYREDVITTDIEYPFSMAVDNKTNILYFSYHDYEFSAGKIDLNTNEFSQIEELTGPCSFTVDQVRHAIYAGCSKFLVGDPGGLYQYDSNIGKFVLIGEENKSVRFIHYNKVLYYSLEHSLVLSTFSRGRSAPVQELSSDVQNMVIDSDNDKVFYNSSGLYYQKSGSLEVTQYQGIYDPMALAVDASGEHTYVCDYKSASIYLLDKLNASSTYVTYVYRCHGITFDIHNNMIYSNIGNHRISVLHKCYS